MVVDNMIYYGLWAQGSRFYEQLKLVGHITYYGLWA